MNMTQIYKTSIRFKGSRSVDTDKIILIDLRAQRLEIVFVPLAILEYRHLTVWELKYEHRFPKIHFYEILVHMALCEILLFPN